MTGSESRLRNIFGHLSWRMIKKFVGPLICWAEAAPYRVRCADGLIASRIARSDGHRRKRARDCD